MVCYPWMLGYALRPMKNTAWSFWIVQIRLGSKRNDGRSRAIVAIGLELVNLIDKGQD